MDFESAKNYILNRLELELPANLHYHGIQHTIDVYEASLRFAEKENVQGRQLVLLKTAALYHDAGFMVRYKDNEIASVEIVKSILPGYNYTKEEIEVISNMILSTQIPQKPKTLLDKILCDADLDYLGREDFFTTAHKLHQEWNANGINTSLVNWYKQQLGFVERHVYFTESASHIRENKKMINLSQVRELVEGLEGNTKYSKFFENIPAGLYRSTPEGKLLMANKMLIDMLGFDNLEDLMKRNLEDTVVARGYNRDRFKQEILINGLVENFESTFIKKDGTTVIIRETAQLVIDSDNRPLFYDGIIQDVTAEALAQEKTTQYLKSIDVANKAYNRFVPINYLKYLKKDSISEVMAGDCAMQRKTIFFSDIRKYSSRAESLNLVANFNFVNSYFKRAIPRITEQDGFVDKLIGDSIMAVFDHSPADAIESAAGVHKELQRVNKYRTRKGFEDLDVAIGIHYGEIMIGALGTADRLEMTVVSDAVNIAARLESVAKQFNAQAVVSESVVLGFDFSEKYFYRYMGPMNIKGRQMAIDLYEFVFVNKTDVDKRKTQYKDDFEDAIIYYIAEDYHECLQILNTILDYNAADLLVQYYVAKCREKISNIY